MTDDLQSAIDAYLDQHWDEVVGDIAQLVRVESVEEIDAASEGAPFGPGPREALNRALAIAERMGFDAHDCEGYVGYADLPGEREAQIGIIGHVDVVPAGVGWHFPAYDVTEKDGYLIGRGVLDDKGPIVVALHAVKFWKDQKQRLPYTIRVLFGANEETGMSDVEYYRTRFEDPAFLFTPDNQFPVGYGESGIAHGALTSGVLRDGHIAEISGGQAANAVPCEAYALVRPGQRALEADGDGAIEVSPADENGLVRITAHGRSAHASTPELGENAIGILVAYLLEQEICSKDERAFLELLGDLLRVTDGSGFGVACADEHFGSLTAVGSVVRYESDNSSGGRIVQTVDFRYPTVISSSDIERKFQQRAREIGAEFSMALVKEPFLMDPDSAAVLALCDAYNEATGEDRKPITSKGGTYARVFTTGVSFGIEKPWEENPEWVGSMHGPDEGVSIDLLKQAFSIYVRTIGKLVQLEL